MLPSCASWSNVCAQHASKHSQRCCRVLQLSFPTLSIRCRGVWIFRGPGIPQIMLDECYDMELYDWVKADINDPVRRVLRGTARASLPCAQSFAHPCMLCTCSALCCASRKLLRARFDVTSCQKA